MHFLPALERLQPYLRASDWIFGIASLGYGLWRESTWWILGGIIMLALAWFDPGTRIKRYAAFIKPAAAPLPALAPQAAKNLPHKTSHAAKRRPRHRKRRK